MQEGEDKVKGQTDVVKRRVWREVDPEESVYVYRCSSCGKFKNVLLKHWFFTGLYCFSCINDVLYDNARNVQEINNDS